MPKGIPLSGKRAPGAGGKRDGAGRPELPDHLKRKGRFIRATDEEWRKVKEFLKSLRTEV